MKKTFILVVLFFMVRISFGQAIVGEIGQDITLPNASGVTMNLSSFKGKVVLVDFWASWCSPCRVANPKLVKLYKKYKDLGFEIFAVGIESSKKSWLAAIKKDKLTYTQVIDTKMWDGKAATDYGVEEIPTSFLLDKTGKIIAIDLQDLELENAIIKALQ